MLSLSHIDFAYEKGPLLLQDLCMEVHDGDYVAVVGENGSGKSTLIKIMLASCVLFTGPSLPHSVRRPMSRSPLILSISSFP